MSAKNGASWPKCQPAYCHLTDRLMEGMGGDVAREATGLLVAPALLVPLLSAAMQSTAKASDEQRSMGGSELDLQSVEHKGSAVSELTERMMPFDACCTSALGCTDPRICSTWSTRGVSSVLLTGSCRWITYR